MATAATYREAVAPPTEQTHKLVLRPEGWKARLWRAFDGSATTMLTGRDGQLCARAAGAKPAVAIASAPASSSMRASACFVLLESEHALHFVRGRIFCGEPVSTSPENAPLRRSACALIPA